MNTAAIGRQAEDVAAVFLTRKGCHIIARNWKTRQCEIDIIAQRGGTVYFCEVKYRARALQGSGMAYITLQKLRQMRFAAESWVHVHGYTGTYQLSAIEVSGPGFIVTNAVRDLL